MYAVLQDLITLCRLCILLVVNCAVEFSFFSGSCCLLCSLSQSNMSSTLGTPAATPKVQVKDAGWQLTSSSFFFWLFWSEYADFWRCFYKIDYCL